MSFVSLQIISVFILPSITRTMFFKARNKSKTKTVYWSPKHRIYFKTTVSIHCLYFYVTLKFKFSAHPCLLNKLCSLFLSVKYQSTSLAALEVKCVWYLRSVSIHLLISFLAREDNYCFFVFPRRLSGVNCTPVTASLQQTKPSMPFVDSVVWRQLTFLRNM